MAAPSLPELESSVATQRERQQGQPCCRRASCWEEIAGECFPHHVWQMDGGALPVDAHTADNAGAAVVVAGTAGQVEEACH